MLHISAFGDLGRNIPHDQDGNVPQAGDDWRDMNWYLMDDPAEAESPTEREEIESYLDDEWWPVMLEQAIEATNQAIGVSR